MQKSYRDPLAYGVRIAMYLGLAILMGTAWLRLSNSQENIQNVLNALFFGSAFMSFMVISHVKSLTKGCRIYPCLSRGSCCDGKRTRKRPLRTNSLPHRKRHHRHSIS